MDREEAKKMIKGKLEEYLIGKGINPSRPFHCLSPEHPDKHPSMSLDRSSKGGLRCKCFSCGVSYDIFDLIGMDYGLTDNAAIFKKAYELYGVDVEAPRTGKVQHGINNTVQKNNDMKVIDDIVDTPVIDLTNEIEAAHNELLATPKALEYLQGRGLSMDKIREYKLGYDHLGYNHLLKAHPDNQATSKKANLYKYIFPYPDPEGRYTYFLSEIEDRSQTDDNNGKYRKIKRGNSNIAAQIFNERYLQDPPDIIFVCEGIYDALSVEEAGGKAMAFVGTAHRRFLGLCKKYRPRTTFVLSLDNDEAGQKAIKEVEEGLDLLKIPHIVKTAKNGKDFNEALQNDRDGFAYYIQQIMDEVRGDIAEKEEEEREEFLKTSVAYQLQDFINNIAKSKDNIYPTGFSNIDTLLEGGMYPGLYVMGAISSLGKTTFALQLADNLAKAGQKVMIISMEMARKELMAKSISRLTLLEDLERNGSTKHAKTTLDILLGSRYERYKGEDHKIIEAATREYQKYAKNIWITEGIGDVTVDRIREKVETFYRLFKKAPVVIIDYLQILAPYNERYTDKQNTDRAVMELKRISRDYEIPVIAISSFNRDNYTEPVNLASFKESGAIEYSSDVLIGLQYEGMDPLEDEDDKKRAKRVRKLRKKAEKDSKKGKPVNIQVKILKNRNGSRGDTLLRFFSWFNYYKVPNALEEREEEDEDYDDEEYEEEWTTIHG